MTQRDYWLGHDYDVEGPKVFVVEGWWERDPPAAVCVRGVWDSQDEAERVADKLQKETLPDVLPIYRVVCYRMNEDLYDPTYSYKGN